MADLTIGMAGMGNLGGPIAERLAEKFPVLGYDPAPADPAATSAVTRVAAPGELARRADIVALCLPTPDAALATVESIAGVPAAERRVRTVVDLSTIGVPTAEQAARIAAAAGLAYVDSPVSGGVPRARNGTLAVMCAGDPAAIAAAEPLQRQIASRVFVMGSRPGLGQAMKLANNIISAAALAVTSEALIFGGRLGLDPGRMIDVINVSTGRTEVSEIKFVQTILPRNYRGAYARVMGKDVSLFLDSARSTGLETPVASRTGDVWSRFVADAPLADFQFIYEYLRDRAG